MKSSNKTAELFEIFLVSQQPIRNMRYRRMDIRDVLFKRKGFFFCHLLDKHLVPFDVKNTFLTLVGEERVFGLLFKHYRAPK